MSGTVNWISRRAGPLHGRLRVPGDKSVSHRAVMLAGLAEGRSRVRGFLEGSDTRATAAIMQQLGVRISAPEDGERIIDGVGLHGLRGIDTALDCGNAGTGMRLLAGLLAGQAFDSTLVGDASLSRRPMRRVIDPLQSMGARIEATSGGTPPLRIHGGRALQGMCYTPPVASAQVKSAILLAGLYAEGATEVIEPRPTRDYTERMLQAFGWPVRFEPGHVRLRGGACLGATDIDVPADFSSAAFLIVAACVVPGSELRLDGIGLNPRRTGLLEALRLMHADIRIEQERDAFGERIGDVIVRHTPLRGAHIPESIVPDMIDEFPALAIAAAAATGTTCISGAAELRVKESDRLAAMAGGLRSLGVEVEERDDGADIVGGALRGGHVDSLGDHRIAMSFAVAGLISEQPVHIDDCANVDTSFPGFMQLANAHGFKLSAG